MCQRWQDSFEAFFEDMGKCPAGMSIDRINNDGNYEPGNCRWAAKIEQMNNMSTNRMVKFNTKTQSVANWGREFGFKPADIISRLNKGMSMLDIIDDLKSISSVLRLSS